MVFVENTNKYFYVITKKYEETIQLIKKLQAFKKQLSILEEKVKRIEGEKNSIDQKMTETQQKIIYLKNKAI